MPDRAARNRTDTVSVVLAVPPEVVFRAFADPDVLMAWLPPAGMSGRALEYDFSEAGRYRMELTYGGGAAGAGKTTARSDVTSGRFLSLEPGKHIVQSVEFESQDAAFAGEMIMTWSFEPSGAGTRVTVTAESVPPGISRSDHEAGLRSTLANLARYLA